MKRKKNIPPELRLLENVVGDFIQYWGFKKIHGRIWTHLFTSKVPLDTASLMERLSVSKGLMSLAIRDLLDYNVIQASHQGKHGSTYYQANPDLMGVISHVLRSRESVMLGSAQVAADRLTQMKPQEIATHELSVERVQMISNLVASAQVLLHTFLSQGGSDQGSLFSPLVGSEGRQAN